MSHEARQTFLCDAGHRHIFVCGISRSGTTLTTTVLDSHPDISMGYELMPVGIPKAGESEALLERAISSEAQDPKKTANLLRDWGHPDLGVFVKRCVRANVTPVELSEVFRSLEGAGFNSFEDEAARSALSLEVVHAKMRKEGTHHSGFKIGPGNLETFAGRFASSSYVCVVRDPRDVVASQMERGIDRSLSRIAMKWNLHVRRSMQALDRRPDRTVVLKYESLVEDPDSALRSVCAGLAVDYSPEMLDFPTSKASVFHPAQRHANDARLRQGFTTEQIARYKTQLTKSQGRLVEFLCRRAMHRMGYDARD